MTWALLVAEFSELAAEVASKYFTEVPSGRYAFRPAYSRCVANPQPLVLRQRRLFKWLPWQAAVLV